MPSSDARKVEKVYWQSQNFRCFTNRFIKGIWLYRPWTSYPEKKNYLTNRKHRTKINSLYSDWLKIMFGVSQASILGPLLFNIFLAEFLFIVNDIETASSKDDNTPYVSGKYIEEVIQFSDNLMLINVIYW